MADRVMVMYGGRVVERGTVEEVFNRPQHPYTWGLLDSIPRLDLPKPQRLPSIAGTPASAGHQRPECVFAARCTHRFEPCEQQPPLDPVSESHEVACWLTPSERRALRVSVDEVRPPS